MANKYKIVLCSFLALILSSAYSQVMIENMQFEQPESMVGNLKVNSYCFKGYTDRWDKYAWNLFTYAGVYQTSQSELKSDLAQMEMYIGNQLILEEIYIQKGFVNKLANANYTILRNTTKETLEKSLNNSDVLLIDYDRNDLLKSIISKLPQDLQYRRNKAFIMQQGTHRLFVVTSPVKEELENLYSNIKKAENIIKKYNLYKGLAGVNTFYYLITQHPENPFEIIDKAIQMGCSWMMISGYNDYMLPDWVNKSLDEIHSPFVFMPGQYVTGGVMYGTKTYPDVQDNTMTQCLEWAEKNKSYYFANLSGYKDKNAKRFSGYIAGSASDQKLIDSLNTPFITNTGSFTTNYPSSMVLFIEKDQKLNEQNIFKAIMDKKAVAVFDKAAMLGPSDLRDGLRILLLEQDYLESQLMHPIALSSRIDNYKLTVTVQNRTGAEQHGNMIINSPEYVKVGDNVMNIPMELNAHEVKTFTYPLSLFPESYGKDNPINISFDVNGKSTRTVNHVNLPDAIEIHSLLLDIPQNIDYPFTIWSYGNQKDVDVKLEIFRKGSNQNVFTDNKRVTISNSTRTISNFNFKLDTGNYIARVSAMGFSKEGIISIKPLGGKAKIHFEDLNKDSIPEIVMENDKIRATVLLFGGRIIEYVLKSRDENLLFKLWPTRPPWYGKPDGFRAFYPYGGLEEFIGYPTIEGQTVFNYKIEKDSGDYVRVKVWANIHGSKIEKIFTLFGNSEVLEARYAFNDMDENIRIIGINPLVQIGPSTGPEDEYYFPAEKLEKRRPVMDRYYGNTFFLKEGWAAGYDTKLKESLVVGYPVNDAMLFHLWNNHPNNTPTPYYYTELQPWIQLKHGQTNYFTYYLNGYNGDWKTAVENFRKLGVVTTR